HLERADAADLVLAEIVRPLEGRAHREQLLLRAHDLHQPRGEGEEREDAGGDEVGDDHPATLHPRILRWSGSGAAACRRWSSSGAAACCDPRRSRVPASAHRRVSGVVMTVPAINYFAVILATLSSMIVGSIWYTPKVF